jgi:hypothetical protein
MVRFSSYEHTDIFLLKLARQVALKGESQINTRSLEDMSKIGAYLDESRLASTTVTDCVQLRLSRTYLAGDLIRA